MAVSAIGGSLVMPVVGWYKPWVDPPAEVKDLFAQLGISPPKGFYRDGGHVMVLAMAKGSAGQSQLVGVRDPAAPNDQAVFYQSDFSTDEYPVVDSLDYFNGYLRLQSRVKDLGSNAFLDGYFAITPKFGLTVQGNTLFWLKPFFLFNENGFSAPIVESFRSPFPGVIVDVAIHPEGTRHPYLVEGDNTIWQIDTLTGASTRFATVDNPSRIVFGGPEQKLYVLLRNHVISLGLDGRQDARVLLDGPLADIAYDGAGDRLAGLSRRDGELVLFHADLGPAGKIPLPGFSCDDRVSLAYEPQSGAVLVHCGHSSRVLRVRLDQGRRGTVEAVELQAARDPLGLTVDDEGHLFVNDGGLLVEYDRSGGLVAGSAFTGLPAGESLDVLRAFNNFDPRTMDNFLYRNVLPEDSGR